MDAKEILLDSLHAVSEKPRAMIPIFYIMLLSLPMLIWSFYIMSTPEALNSVHSIALFLYSIFMILVDMLIQGMYPSIATDAMNGSEIDLSSALSEAYHKFWSLLGAFALVILIYLTLSMVTSLLVVALSSFGMVGAIAGEAVMFVIIFLIMPFFYYIPPAIILDDLKALQGFSKAVSVGRNNFVSTLAIVITLSILALLSMVLLIYLPIYFGVELYYVLSILMIPFVILAILFSSWGMVAQSYAYMKQ